MRWQALYLAKDSNREDEYEDAFAADAAAGRFALADGASESSFAGPWARLLVQEFIRLPLSGEASWTQWLPPLRLRWSNDFAGRVLPWYAEAKVQIGAFATILGLLVEQHSWQAIAIGDTCLFQIRGDRLVESFPLTSADRFDSMPDLVGSCVPPAAALETRQRRGHGCLESEDSLWLMTDALAQWFLREVEAGTRPWIEIRSLLNHSYPERTFVDWVGERRHAAAMRNDDVTLLAVQPTG